MSKEIRGIHKLRSKLGDGFVEPKEDIMAAGHEAVLQARALIAEAMLLTILNDETLTMQMRKSHLDLQVAVLDKYGDELKNRVNGMLLDAGTAASSAGVAMAASAAAVAKANKNRGGKKK